jgi:outer membrane protein
MSEMWQAGPVLQFRNERDDVDNNRVDNMDDVDNAVEAGAFVGLTSGPWAASLTFATDVSDEHEGSLVEIEGSYTTAVSEKLRFTFGANLTYADDDYMGTYFGVNAADAARSGLPLYGADGGLKDVGVNVTGQYRLRGNWGLLGVISYDRLLGDAKDSPLVDDEGDENQWGAILAVTYSF